MLGPCGSSQYMSVYGKKLNKECVSLNIICKLCSEFNGIWIFRVVAVNTQKKSHYLWKYEWVHKIYNTESFLSNFQTAVFNF